MLPLAATLLFLLAPAEAPKGSVLIISSAGPSARALPPGMRLAPGQKLRLGRQDRVTMLQGGVVRNFKGPQTVIVGSAAATSAAPAALALVERRIRLGGIREARQAKRQKAPVPPAPAAAPAEARPHIWYVDADRDTVACTTRWDGMQGLWRRDGSSSAVYVLKNEDGKEFAKLHFPVGVTFQHFPRLSIGRQFEIVTGDGTRRIRLLRITEPVEADANERVARLSEELIKHGCRDQLEFLATLLEKAERSEAAAEPN